MYILYNKIFNFIFDKLKNRILNILQFSPIWYCVCVFSPIHRLFVYLRMRMSIDIDIDMIIYIQMYIYIHIYIYSYIGPA